MTSLQDALDNAYRFLGHRDRTVAEVRAHLVEKKLVDDQVASAAIEELLELGYLDDATFARRFAEDRRALDSWGSIRIGRRLAELGVAPDLIEAVVAASSSASELDMASELLERRFRGRLEDPRERQRALGVLARKGFDLELAYTAIRRCSPR